jgi:hypothetical protein
LIVILNTMAIGHHEMRWPQPYKHEWMVMELAVGDKLWSTV